MIKNCPANRLKNHSIKKKILTFSITFTLAMSILVAVISYTMFYYYNKSRLINSTEINVKLITDQINDHTESVYSLVRWCQVNTRLAEYMLNGDTSNESRLTVFEKVSDMYEANRSKEYINRLILSNFSKKYLQIVSTTYSTANDIPEIAMQLPYFKDALYSESYDYSMGLVRDPFMNTDAMILPIIKPIYHPYNSTITGWVMAALSQNIFSDAIETYVTEADENVYLVIDSHTYLYTDGTFTEVDEQPWKSNTTKHNAIYSDSLLHKSSSGGNTLYVERMLKLDNCSVVRNIPSQLLYSQFHSILYVIIILVFAVILAGIGFTIYLNRLVNTPINKLLDQMNEVSKGNFKKNPEVEWNNEFGTIGKGVNDLSENVSRLMDKRIEAENEKRSYEYKMLQSQINPHFLYNTLNSIKWMATVQNATGIPEMTTALSHLLKNIAKSTEIKISLRSELELLNDYYIIQKYRYGGSVTMEVTVDDEELYDCEIIRFSLQPLVENAIFHGIEPKGTAGRIDIHVYRNDTGDICISVTDDGVGMSEEVLSSLLTDNRPESSQFFKEFGISNVHKRIQYEYGNGYGLSFESEIGKYTKATITLPGKE